MLFILMVSTQSCETDIPPEDLTPPKFSFQIHGDNFYHDFNQDSDFGNIILILKAGNTYEFTFTATDQGGVASASWGRSDVWKTSIETLLPAPWTFYYGHNNIYGSINWEGDNTNPLTGAIVTGIFKVIGQVNERTSFSFGVSDFGGEQRMPNYISKSLSIQIAAGPTRISFP